MAYLRARRSIKVAPGFKVNLNKRSVGITVGTRGAHYSVNTSGRRTTTVGIPGTGLSIVNHEGGHRSSRPAPKPVSRPASSQGSATGGVKHHAGIFASRHERAYAKALDRLRKGRLTDRTPCSTRPSRPIPSTRRAPLISSPASLISSMETSTRRSSNSKGLSQPTSTRTRTSCSIATNYLTAMPISMSRSVSSKLLRERPARRRSTSSPRRTRRPGVSRKRQASCRSSSPSTTPTTRSSRSR
jgi:Protein of unknown function (DUF4236)